MDSFLKIYRKHVATFIWVKGHDDNKENERCDVLAVKAAEGDDLRVDGWYENNVASRNELF